MKKLFLFIILFSSITLYSQHITRGNQPGELYIPSTWYYLGGQNNFDAIFYSDNFGETLEIKYVNNIGSGNMPIGKLISDATAGVIYNNYNSLWISYDSANSWSFIEDIGTDKRYTSGCTEGEIYKYCKNPTSFLYRSTDYGQNLIEINSGVFGFPEVGTNEGELYIFTGSTWPTFNVDLLLSTNYGESFDTIFIDSITGGNYLSGNFPVISRGTLSGEIYLVSWHLPSNYHIFHSVDYGQSFELKFVSDECEFYFENYSFTAGKESGEFYVVKHLPWFDGTNTELYIYYSNDTANTFTEYYHLLDEYFPVNTGDKNKNYSKIQINSFPNPFKDKISLELRQDFEMIKIYNLNGKSQFEKSLLKENKTETINLKKLEKGIYILKIKTKKQDLTKKIIKI